MHLGHALTEATMIKAMMINANQIDSMFNGE